MDPSLNFSVSLKPKVLVQSIQPDIELTPDSPDPNSKKDIYKQYENFSSNDTDDHSHSQEFKILDHFGSSSTEYDLRQAGHPIVCLFTLFFKTAAALTYLFFDLFFDDKILTFIFVVILVCFDFWYTKNISGRLIVFKIKFHKRLLVGLLWTNKFNQSGEEIWLYESHQCAEVSNRVDKAFFWSSLAISTCFWIFFSIGNILSLRLFWLCLTTFAFLLNSINIYGFYKCRGEHQKKLNEMKLELTKQGMNVVGMVMLKSIRKV